MNSATTNSLLSFSIAFVIVALVLYFAKPKYVKKDDKVSNKKVVLVSLIISSIVGIVALVVVKSTQQSTQQPTYAPSSSLQTPSYLQTPSALSSVYGMLNRRY